MRLATEIVRDFEAHPDAPEGEIHRGSMADLHLAEPGDLVICRLNAPVISECLNELVGPVESPADAERAGYGRDVLGRWLLFFNGPEGRFPLAFPSPA